LEAEQHKIEQQRVKTLKKEGSAITAAAEQYLSQLSENGLQLLKDEFNYTPHAKGLRF
ncbi:MAG: hypothetical protein HN455_12880, partial [Gammaproteobacteria bacterium]|nr:hypothetical protein [Gammaproteobacteria bacterium]MBT6479434.1 hypothetical protein [Gammaproteobacteria bacterium]